MRALQTTRVIHKALQIPIRVCNVVKSSSGQTGLSNACPDCEADVGMKNVCKSCNKEISHADLKKKYKITEEDQHILTAEELSELKNIDSDIKIEGSVSQDQFKESMIVGSYYLLPSTKLKKKSEQNLVLENKDHYARLRQTVLDCPDPIVVKFSIRQKEKLGILKVEGDVIIMLSIAFNEYLQDQDEDLKIDLSESMKKDSAKFVKSIKKTDLATIKDTYNETLEAILSGNVKQQKPKQTEDDMWGSL